MTIIQKEKDGIMELSISGRLDAVSAVEADKDFKSVLDAGHKNLLVDLDRLNYIRQCRSASAVSCRKTHSAGRRQNCFMRSFRKR